MAFFGLRRRPKPRAQRNVVEDPPSVGVPQQPVAETRHPEAILASNVRAANEIIIDITTTGPWMTGRVTSVGGEELHLVALANGVLVPLSAEAARELSWRFGFIAEELKGDEEYLRRRVRTAVER